MKAQLDRVVHEPVRLKIMTILSRGEELDFNFLLGVLGLTKGNLSRHTEKLEAANYVKIEKSFSGNIPKTCYKITQKGSSVLAQYWKNVDAIRRLGQ